MNKFVRWTALLGFVLVVLGILFGFLYARQWARSRFQREQANQAWREWKQETESAAASKDRPVQRRPAVSSMPPTFVLLEEHFWVCWGGTVLVAGVIYWTFAILLMGSMRPRTTPDSNR